MMRVFLFSLVDNGQQHFLLAQAMRKYLGWEAMSMIRQKTYLDYPTDWILEDDAKEARDYIKDADMIILQDMLMDVEELGLKEQCGHKNTIINGTGSKMRNMIPLLKGAQEEGWAVVPCLADETLSARLCSPPFENWIVPVEKIRELADGIKRQDKISICHAPTAKGIKGTEIIESILQPWIDSGKIEYERITKCTWKEAIQRKAKHHIILDSFGNLTQTYGAGNALEGLALQQTVVSKISPWAYCLHPDLPMKTTWMKDTKTVIESAIEWERVGLAPLDKTTALQWVREHFAAENQIKHWEQYINWVQTRGN